MDLVWVELDPVSRAPIRIFKNHKTAFAAQIELLAERDYGTAVRSIRHQLFVQARGYCNLCAGIVTEVGCHMHERLHRGRFDADGHSGEISVANSIIICAKCHLLEHPEREIKFTRRQS